MFIPETRFCRELATIGVSAWTSANLPDSEEVSLHLAADLLQSGGYAVLPGTQIADAWLIVYGETVDGEAAILANDVNDICHANCFEQATETKQHFIGYALSADGQWHEHSWLVENGEILETTGTARIAYHGVHIGDLPAASLGLLEGEMLSSEDALAHEDAAKDVLKVLDCYLRDAVDSRNIIDAAVKRRAVFAV